jgi:hypothetical protein
MQRNQDDSTRVITSQLMGLKPFVEEQKSPTDDNEEYVMVDLDNEFTEYEVVKEFYYHRTYAYLPNTLNSDLFKLLNKKYPFQATVADAKFERLAYSCFKKDEETVVLFNAVSDRQVRTIETYPLLDEALQHYKKNQTYKTHDTLIIPVVEQTRNHYRLLVFKNGEFNYYDSKNYLYSLAFRAGTFLTHVARETMHDVAQTRQKFDKASGFLEHLRASGELAGNIIVKTAINLTRSSEVKEICIKHFPAAIFGEYALQHQAMFDHYECAVFSAAYAELAAAGKSPRDLSEDVNVLRARLIGVESDAVLSETVNTENFSERLVTRCKA